MHSFKIKTLAGVFSFIGMMLLTLSLTAQSQEYDDAQLRKFANVIVEVITIQQESQKQMIALIEERDLSIERFNEMMIESQDKTMEEIEGSEAEKEAFADISVEIMGIQEEMEDQLIKSIEDEGLTIQQYEQILQDYQQDPELQQRIQRLVK